MLYSDALLMAAKKVNLVDANQPYLSNEEKNMYSYALQDAVARFNNDRNLSIGQARTEISKWNSSQSLGPFFLIVRDSGPSGSPRDLLAYQDGENNLSWLEVSPATDFQEIPQRLNALVPIAPSWQPGLGNSSWTIVNETDYEGSGQGQNIACYSLRQNHGLLRVRNPQPLIAIFDRALFFPWVTAPMNNLDQTNIQDPLDVNVEMPTTHVPYFVNLVAYELGMNMKLEPHIRQALEKSIYDQYTLLCSANVTDRVKQPFTMRDRIRNAVLARAYN